MLTVNKIYITQATKCMQNPASPLTSWWTIAIFGWTNIQISKVWDPDKRIVQFKIQFLLHGVWWFVYLQIETIGFITFKQQYIAGVSIACGMWLHFYFEVAKKLCLFWIAWQSIEPEMLFADRSINQSIDQSRKWITIFHYKIHFYLTTRRYLLN